MTDDDRIQSGSDAKPETPPGRKPDVPPAGPHAQPHLTNPDATPGTGMLPPVGEDEDPNAQPSG
ncbi:hypothetical protein MWN34_07315 [Ancylobacter sp. 6x-1]|uniref:Sigma-like protein n=1 Tax=Ancylobacter crimeensis TaxID=2579147 RepID=A0ABT0D9T9_9HYPH|nr:hypothetical protein [Ancylobacter crimeensis]MCK0196721.1 hypothetical protein [Ancylobacter crimeensis]